MKSQSINLKHFIFTDISFYMCMVHFFIHFFTHDSEPYDLPHHALLNLIMLINISRTHIATRIHKSIKITLMCIYAMGIYYLLQRWIGFFDPINIVNIPYSISLFIFTSLFNCTLVYAWQYNKYLNLRVLLHFVIISALFSLGEAGENKYILITEYWFYKLISYRYLN